jgi:hypothetical protein
MGWVVNADLKHLGKLTKKLERDHMRAVRARVGRIGMAVGREALARSEFGMCDPATGRAWAAQERPLGHPVLRVTGEMLAARIVRFKRMGNDRTLKIFMTAKKGFKSKRFWVHQKGSVKRRMPARPIIGFSGDDMDRIHAEAMAAVTEAFRAG